MQREGLQNVGDTIMIRRKLYELNESDQFERFDRFIMKKVLSGEHKKYLDWPDVSEEILLSLREEAFFIIYKKIKSKKVASRITVKKWFGLEGCARPKRIHIIKLALALHFTEDELQEYLIQGILQPGIQINDYREMIYLYGISSHLSYEECQDMIHVFEKKVYKDTVLAQNTHTLRLWEMYRANAGKPKEEFLAWMCNNAGFFKGYSKVALHHFMEMKREMLCYIRENAKERLFQLLQETDFEDWALENGIENRREGEVISRYLKNMNRRKGNGGLTAEIIEAIRELNWIAHSSREKTTDLLAELYASALETASKKKRIQYKKRESFKLPEQVSFLTEKEISQIVGIAWQKEKEIRLSQADASLDDVNGTCPDWIRRMLLEYGIQAPKEAVKTKALLRKLLVEQEQRCHFVQREDLLPLIHYVAQIRYMHMINEQEMTYCRDDAVNFFIQLADSILAECCMAPVNTKYQLDFLLLTCYGKENLYSLADVIEEAERTTTYV